jgi:hypothetical protein
MKLPLDTTTTLFLASVLALLSSNSALGFYDSSSQRWLNRDPLGEGAERNLYRPVSDDQVDLVDPTGLEKLSLTFDFAIPAGADVYNEPDDAIFVDRSAQVLSIARSKVGKYDPEGKSCNCISSITIAAHGGGEGVAPLGDIEYSAPVYADYLAKQALLTPDQFQAYVKQHSYLRDSARARAALEDLAGLKCNSGIRVTILACNAGGGPAGEALRQDLLGIFGPNATVVTYQGSCGFSPFGGTSGKRDPMGWDKKKVGH